MVKIFLIVVLLAGTAHADAGDRWDGVMVLEQTGGGAVGGLVFGAAGVFVGAAAAGNEKGWAALGTAAMGGVIGCVVGVTVGVKLSGDWRGGNGGWGATTIGAVSGGLLTFATLPQYAEKVPTPVAISLASISLLAPTIVAYHLSSDENASTEKRLMVPLVLSSF